MKIKISIILLAFFSILRSQIIEETANNLFFNDLSKDKITIIELWASWCGPCMQTLEKIGKLEEIHDNDIQFLLVNSYDSIQVSQEILNKYQISSPNISDLDKSISKHYNINMVGNLLIFNRNKTKYWIGSPAILSEKYLPNLLNKNEIISIETKDLVLSIETENYSFKLQTANSYEQRKLEADTCYLKITNVPFTAIFENLNPGLTFVDQSDFELFYTFEYQFKNDNKGKKLIFERLIEYLNAQVVKDKVYFNTDKFLKKVNF